TIKLRCHWLGRGRIEFWLHECHLKIKGEAWNVHKFATNRENITRTIVVPGGGDVFTLLMETHISFPTRQNEDSWSFFRERQHPPEIMEVASFFSVIDMEEFCGDLKQLGYSPEISDWNELVSGGYI
ncbi:MAG: hypothetical protein N2C14_18955, partial [Planctomycetales bacterium]